MDSSFSNLHVTIVSSPGMGHLIPALVLANTHNVKTTVLQVTTAISQPDFKLLNLPIHTALVEMVELPPVDISHLVGPTTQVFTQLCLMVREALPFIRSAIASMDRRPDVFIADLFGTETIPIALDFNIPKYVYIPTSTWFTALITYSPVLDQQTNGQYVDQIEYLKIPGCKSVRPEDVVEPMLDRTDKQYHEYIRMGKEMVLFDGFLINSWEDLEPTTLQAFRENEIFRSIVKIPVYPIGPLRRPVIEPDGLQKSDLISWLDQQPNDSVLFVSFGSGGMLSKEQITELAWGLELSKQRFVWVVRPPTKGRVDDAFFSVSNGSNGTPDFLPEGFLTRILEVGFLVPMWAQQVEILNHPSIGGFLSHCGWNSTLESITSGVPLIAWPLYAEQRLNATILVEELGVALRPKVLPTKQVVGRKEIETLVRTLMQDKEGKAIRDTVKKLQISATNALSEGGSSHKAMHEILSKIVR